MAGKFRIVAEINLATTVAPDGYLTGVEDEVLDYEFSESWGYGEDVRLEGCDVSFVIEAASEDEAREKACIILDGAGWGGDSLEWEVSDYDISEIEEIEPPMDLARATEIIRAFLTRIREMGGVTSDEEEAFSFLLDTITP